MGDGDNSAKQVERWYGVDNLNGQAEHKGFPGSPSQADHLLRVGCTVHCHIGRETMLVEPLGSLTFSDMDFPWRVA